MTTPQPHKPPDWKAQVKLYLVTDDSGRSPQALADVISRAIDGGVTAVQFREKKRPADSCAAAFNLVSKACLREGVPLLLNADLLGSFPIEAPYAGIHYSIRTLHRADSYPAHAMGFSAHTLREARDAVAAGVDFCTLSPIFDTPSKAGILAPLGTAALRKARQALPALPLVALGGIDAANTGECISAGADGVAVIRYIMDAPDPAAAAKKLRLAAENHTSR